MGQQSCVIDLLMLGESRIIMIMIHLLGICFLSPTHCLYVSDLSKCDAAFLTFDSDRQVA
jgi:hypothetical protein